MVPLRFIERRSGLSTDVQVEGWLQRIDTGRGCGGDYWLQGELPLWTTSATPCGFSAIGGTGVGLLVRASEIEKLVAGRWDARLSLDLRAEASSALLATYTFTFELTITDHANASIYFPTFDQITPHVSLNVDYNPIGPMPTVGGRAALDMCLYDGLGSQSPYLEVTVSDTPAVAPGRPPGMYSVWHHQNGGGEEDRLDYQILLDYGGTSITLRNAVTETLMGTDTAQLRLVVLPGMSQPVYCVPTPLVLLTPSVSAASKKSGYYQGALRLEVNVPTGTP